MLPAALLTYRIAGDRIVPAFLGPEDHPWLRSLIEARAGFVGRRRRELRDGLQLVAAPTRKRALAAHVLDGLAPDARPRGLSPREVRAAVFGAATGPRAEQLAAAAAQLGVSPGEIEARLFADLPDERLVGDLRSAISPVELAARANLELAAGLLGRASQIRIELDGNALPVVRRAKLRGLIVHVAAAGTVEISGPLALFHHTRVYGRALGSLLPQLAWCARFRLRAECVLAEGRYQLELDRADPIFPAEEPRRHDSKLEERFERDLRRIAPAWEVVRDPQPIVAGAALAFPDFALVDRADPSRRWLIELVGFWTPEYLVAKLAAYRAAALPNLVLCIDESRRCADGDLPEGARVVWYRRSVPAEAVLAAIATAPCDVLDAVRAVAETSPYGNAFLPAVERRLQRRVPLGELVAMARAGVIAVNRPTRDFAIRPLDPPRPPIVATAAAVERHLEAAIDATRRGPAPPLYHLVRERFDWLDADGNDVLLAVVEDLARRGVVRLEQRRGKLTIEAAVSRSARP